MPAVQNGTLRYHREFVSRFLRTPRDIIVWLPPDYDENSTRRYPVLYMHDGQNLFDPATAFAGNAWGMGEAAGDLISSGQIEPLIVVGIYNTGETRMAEYTHVRDHRGRGGLARAYARTLVKELKPLIDREYRTLPWNEDTGLGGSSLGGLVTLYIGLEYPRVFGKLIVMSPSVWWAGRSIIRSVEKHPHQARQKIWLDIGTCEGSNPDSCIRDTRDLRDTLAAKGWQVDRDLRFIEDLGAGHHEAAWGRRMRDALLFLFRDKLSAHD